MDILTTIQSNKKNQFWIFLSVLVFLTLFMMLCNGSSASYSGFDFFFHYRRLYALTEAFKIGSYPSYLDYSNVDGYGYFTNGFYSDVILIPFALIGILTGTYFAYDFMVFTMTILCGVFMYYTVKVIYKSSYAAFISGILYAFAIYRLQDVYQRGALGEALSFTFLPIVFLGLYHIIRGDYKKWYILAIGYSLLIYTHVIASVLMFVTLLILLIVYYKPLIKEPKRIAYLFLAGGITIVLVSYFIFPTLEQLHSNSFYLDSRHPGGGAGYGKVGFDLVLWGLVSGIAYPVKKLWAGVGILLTTIVFLRFLVKGEKSSALRSVDIGVIIGICFIIASSRIIPWGRFPFNLIGFIQYPWRLYEFVSFFFAVAGGYYLSLLFRKNKQKTICLAVIVIATMLTTYAHSENFRSLYSKKTGDDLLMSEVPVYYNRYHTVGGEYFPSKLPNIEYIHERGEVVEARNEDTKIANLKRDKNITVLEVAIAKPDTLILPLIYYYGYNVTLQGKSIPYTESDFGLIAVPVSQSGEIKAYYAGTTLQKTSFFISIIAILTLIIFIIRSNKKVKDEDIE